MSSSCSGTQAVEPTISNNELQEPTVSNSISNSELQQLQKDLQAIQNRRSRRVLDQDPIIAPGYGTRKDLLRLTAELSNNQTSLPFEAVQAVMKSRGRGIRSSSRNKDPAEDASQAAAAATPVSSAWADFMKEEGMGDADKKRKADDKDNDDNDNGRSSRSASKKQNSGNHDDGMAHGSSGATSSRGVRMYEFPPEWQELEQVATSDKGKKKKASSKSDEPCGILLQAGTLDANIVGRTKLKASAPEVYHCPVPTRILGSKIQVSQVFTSCNAVHSFALATNGVTYAWGRNENHQLGLPPPQDGQEAPKAVYMPTELELPAPLHMAALGKSHTLFLLQDQSMYAVGANKTGQCSVRNYQDVSNLKKCVVPEGVVWAQIACGEDFTMALSTAGHVYSCGCSQYGQLGTGETGEYFVTANKLAYTNANVLERRNTFCYAPTEKLHSNNEVSKVVPIPQGEEILIQQLACGKHHTLLVEANSSERSRVFSFGCGDYGVLGHGIQKDEYFPRLVGVIGKIPMGQDQTLSVSAGAHCSLLKTSAGHVYYWGKHKSAGEAVMRPQLVDALANNQHVVTAAAAGGQTVICSTTLAQTVAWGQGPHGELGLGKAKSSSKPTFVESLNGIQVLSVAAGYGHTLFIVDQKKGSDNAEEKLPQVNEEDVEALR